MIWISLTLFLLLTLVSSTLYFSVKKNLEFLDQQESLLSTIEQSLQSLEISYKKIDKKSKLQLFSDEAIVKELIDDMKEARRSILIIAENLTGEKEVIETSNKNEDIS